MLPLCEPSGWYYSFVSPAADIGNVTRTNHQDQVLRYPLTTQLIKPAMLRARAVVTSGSTRPRLLLPLVYYALCRKHAFHASRGEA